MITPLDCPEAECWQALFNDTLPKEQRERWERHLETCAACQGRLDRTVEGGDDLLRLARQVGDPTLAPSDSTLLQIQERVLQSNGPNQTATAGPTDLFFLHPTDRPGILGTLGDYEVQEIIGQGGMGVVLKAVDPPLHRLVAIKVLSPALAGSATARRRFIREAQAAAAVCHDHIVAVHGVHEVDALPYLVMQYVAGESLQARLDRAGPLEVSEVVRIGMQTASGLAAAHAQGLIHRDVKPANLLLENGLARVKITDFGLARMIDDAHLTQNGVVVGTPEYMAPEQARGELVDHRADLFSLGSVLYAMCTGSSPFRGSTALSVLRKVSEKEPVAIRSLNPDVPVWLEELVGRLLAKDPADRFQTAAEVAALLEGYLAHLQQPMTIPAPQVTYPPAGTRPGRSGTRPPDQPFRWAWQHLGQLALLLLAAVGLISLLQVLAPGQQEQPAEEFYQDFRGGAKPLPPLRLVGPDAKTVTTSEKEGLRITLPAMRKDTNRVGVQLDARLKGNLEITAGYEIIRGDRPTEGHGVGVELFIALDSPTKDDLGLFRTRRVVEGEVYLSSWTTIENGERHYYVKHVPASARAGRLRITRVGTEATLLAADGDSDEFRVLWQQEVGPADVKVIRFSAYPGHAQNALDVRLKGLRVRSPTAIEAKALTAQPATPPEEREGQKGWVVAAGLLVLAILTMVLVVWFAAQRGRRTAEGPAGDSEQTKPDEDTGIVPFACLGCGKKLKARATMAGKRVKCPQCNQAVAVPGNTTDSHDGRSPA